MSHLPFPGEKCYIWDGRKETGSFSNSAIWSNLDISAVGVTTTFVATDEFLVWSGEPTLLLSTDPLGGANWVLEATSGSAVVELYTSYDTGWNEDPMSSYTWTLQATATVTTGRTHVPLPSGDLNYSQLVDNGAPLLRVKVISGTVTLEAIYLQVEPPDGLKTYTTSTPSSWFTPAETVQTAAMQLRTIGQHGHVAGGTTSTAYTHSGTYNGEGATNPDYEVSPTGISVFNDLLDTVLGLSEADTSPVTVTGNWQPTAVMTQFMFETFNHHGGALPPSFDYHVSNSGGFSCNEMKSLWADVTTVTSTSGLIPAGSVPGRDYVRSGGSYFGYSGTSHSVGWRPGYVMPYGTYAEDGYNASAVSVSSGDLTSPHDDSYSITGTVSDGHAGSAFPLNHNIIGSGSPRWPNTNSPISVTPTFGTDVLGTPSMSISTFAQGVYGPLGARIHRYPNSTWRVISQLIWYWCHLVGSEYQAGAPQLRVQPPDVRYFVPDFVPSPDAFIVPAGEPFLPFESSTEAGEYVYEGDVGVGCAPPHLWFIYKTWGFLGHHIVVYGQGMGSDASALHGHLKIGNGWPGYPTVGDIEPTIVDWSVNAASSHAYDGTGVVFPGTEIAPPVVDAEVQTIEFVIPATIDLSSGPQTWHVYLENDCGRSNALLLMLYPEVDVEMEGADPDLLSVTGAMGVFGRPTSDGQISLDYSLMGVDYVLTGRWPERPPEYLTNAVPAFALTGGTPTTGLDDPVDVALPLERRYRPLDSLIEARPDLGTDVSVWNSIESSAYDWKFHAASAPFVDDTTTVSSRLGDIDRPAMVFDGIAWAELTANLGVGPAFTMAMAVTLHPSQTSRAYIFSSFVVGVPDPDSFPCDLFLEGDQWTLHVGTKLVSGKIAPGYIGQRPVIIELAVSAGELRFAFVSDAAVVRTVTHPKMTSSGLRLYLGRSNDPANLRLTTMDILDLGLSLDYGTQERFWTVINRLDSAYGVMK